MGASTGPDWARLPGLACPAAARLLPAAHHLHCAGRASNLHPICPPPPQPTTRPPTHATRYPAAPQIKSVLGFGYGLKPFSPTFDLRAELHERASPYAKAYRHWGPLVLTLDYTRAKAGGGTQRVVDTIVCPSDNAA